MACVHLPSFCRSLIAVFNSQSKQCLPWLWMRHKNRFHQKHMAHLQLCLLLKSIPLLCPSGCWLPSLPLQRFPRLYQRELQTKLLSILASLYVSDEIRFKPGSILYSADSNQTETSVTWDMIASIFTLFRPVMVLSCSSRGRREQRNLNCSPSGWNQLPSFCFQVVLCYSAAA